MEIEKGLGILVDKEQLLLDDLFPNLSIRQSWCNKPPFNIFGGFYIEKVIHKKWFIFKWKIYDLVAHIECGENSNIDTMTIYKSINRKDKEKLIQSQALLSSPNSHNFVFSLNLMKSSQLATACIVSITASFSSLLSSCAILAGSMFVILKSIFYLSALVSRTMTITCLPVYF